MPVNPLALTIRAKKLGALIRDARLAEGKSAAECAQAMGVSEVEYQEFELGEKSPSLPQLETLAYHLNINMEHFWGDQARSTGVQRKTPVDMERARLLRQRIIGARLRKARLEVGLSLEELAERAWSSATLLESFELGEAPIPLPDLEVLSGLLSRPVRDFQDSRGPVGAWIAEQHALRDFMTLSPELRAFVSKPINRPFLELAQRLSEMDVTKLRGVAEGLLEITY